jgi:hypothetical protein
MELAEGCGSSCDLINHRADTRKQVYSGAPTKLRRDSASITGRFTLNTHATSSKITNMKERKKDKDVEATLNVANARIIGGGFNIFLA